MNAALYEQIVERRRRFFWPGYQSYAEAGLEGDWVTPYHRSSASFSGPVLLTYNFLDAPTAQLHRERLLAKGYLEEMPFNRVLDLALSKAGLQRSDIYVTHCFHLLARTRSETVPAAAINASFEAIARHELQDRMVIALGREAIRQCQRFGIAHLPQRHLSARGESFSTRAMALAEALREAERLTCRSA